MQDLNDLLYFAEVVDRGGFAAAGRALGIPKSRLSRRVADLEERVGVRLLHRTTRKLSLTQAGEVYWRHCVAMREQARAADESVALVQTEPRGTIRVACPITLAQTEVGRVLPLFLARHPEVTIDLRVSNRVVDLLEEGIDVALRVRTSLDESGSLVIKKLGPTQSLLVASPRLLARDRRPTAVGQLEGMATVAMAAQEGRASLALRGPQGEEHVLQHRPRLVADDLMTLKHAVLDGLGMASMPDYLCRDELADGRLVEVLPGWRPPPAIVHAVFPSRRGLVPAVRRFLDFLGEHMRTA